MAEILTVANWFLKQKPMTHKKLQKMSYYAQAWSYALLDRPLIDDDSFEAWASGPVSPRLYQRYQRSYWKPLEIDPDTDTEITDPDDLWILQSVLLTYGNHSGQALAELARSEEPWIKAFATSEKQVDSHKQIDPEIMRKYYRSIYIDEAAQA